MLTDVDFGKQEICTSFPLFESFCSGNHLRGNIEQSKRDWNVNGALKLSRKIHNGQFNLIPKEIGEKDHYSLEIFPKKNGSMPFGHLGVLVASWPYVFQEIDAIFLFMGITRCQNNCFLTKTGIIFSKSPI